MSVGRGSIASCGLRLFFFVVDPWGGRGIEILDHPYSRPPKLKHDDECSTSRSATYDDTRRQAKTTLLRQVSDTGVSYAREGDTRYLNAGSNRRPALFRMGKGFGALPDNGDPQGDAREDR